MASSKRRRAVDGDDEEVELVEEQSARSNLRHSLVREHRRQTITQAYRYRTNDRASLSLRRTVAQSSRMKRTKSSKDEMRRKRSQTNSFSNGTKPNSTTRTKRHLSTSYATHHAFSSNCVHRKKISHRNAVSSRKSIARTSCVIRNFESSWAL